MLSLYGGNENTVALFEQSLMEASADKCVHGLLFNLKGRNIS